MNILKWNSFVRIFKNIKICQLSDLHKSLTKVFCVILINANLYDYYILTVDLQSLPQQLGYKNFIWHKHFYEKESRAVQKIWVLCRAAVLLRLSTSHVLCSSLSATFWRDSRGGISFINALIWDSVVRKLHQLVQARICIINQKPLIKHFISDIN